MYPRKHPTGKVIEFFDLDDIIPNNAEFLQFIEQEPLSKKQKSKLVAVYEVPYYEEDDK